MKEGDSVIQKLVKIEVHLVDWKDVPFHPKPDGPLRVDPYRRGTKFTAI